MRLMQRVKRLEIQTDVKEAVAPPLGIQVNDGPIRCVDGLVFEPGNDPSESKIPRLVICLTTD